MTPARPVESLFRREYGPLVARLSRRVGVHHLAAVEDAAQSALLAALKSWPRDGVPDNPPAWLGRVAWNHLADGLRRRSRRRELLDQKGERRGSEPPREGRAAGEVDDDLLRMLFVCCDGGLPEPSQLALAMKVLLGFNVPEIALRLFTSEANVYKRLGRARKRLRSRPRPLPDITAALVRTRLPRVHRVLHLLYAEGHLSAHQTEPVRRELCEEATRLASVLAAHPAGRTPETCALLALMHLHTARLPARQDNAGGLLLLDEQDRGQWDTERIRAGLEWLSESARGDVYSRYHAEAGIAAEHCLAPSFEETRWDRIADAYALLDRLAPSALHTLNHAVALAEARGPAVGLALLDGLEPPTWLSGSYMWAAVLSDLHGRCGRAVIAERYRDRALALAPSEALATLLRRRLKAHVVGGTA